MSRKLPFLLAIILCATADAPAQTTRRALPGSAIIFSVTDERKVIAREIGDQLLLRVVKERSATQEHFGWRVEVVRKPYRPSLRNLLYHSRRTLGAHPSQLYAWHIAAQHFPNERELEVWGRPLVVRVELLEPVVEGSDGESKFVSGKIRITWARKRAT